jgi:class 3 adenylate cyclase
MRINDDQGAFVGVLRLATAGMLGGLVIQLARGDPRAYERMNHVSEPALRPSAILFADLEASGDLSRRVSSRAYFALVRSFVDLVDGHVVDEQGIVGKHAGDGATALFLAEHAGSESAAAANAIRVARAIRQATAEVGPDDVEVRVNVGLHWGATIMVGQLSTRGRLEVTALGDEMNEAARIESVASDGTVLASKNLLERLSPDAAAQLDIDLESVTYRTVAQLGQSNAKAVRDAGSIPVTPI